MLLFQKIITETQISNPPEPAMDHNSIKYMIFLPFIAIYFRLQRYETPSMLLAKYCKKELFEFSFNLNLSVMLNFSTDEKGCRQQNKVMRVISEKLRCGTTQFLFQCGKACLSMPHTSEHHYKWVKFKRLLGSCLRIIYPNHNCLPSGNTRLQSNT